MKGPDGVGRRERLAGARLYVVTGAHPRQGGLEEFLDVIMGAGAAIVQLREKDAEAGDLIRWGGVFREAARRHESLFVVNDRPDVALALGADGVHLGQNDLPVPFARELLGPDAIIGLSTHSRDQLERAHRGADYVCVGPIYATPTKPGRPAVGLDLVRAADRLERRPWFAIGGVDDDTLPRVVEAGARRVVVVRAVTEADDPGDAVRRLLERLPA